MAEGYYRITNMTDTQTNNKTEERRNRFTGESIQLTAEEADKHDEIFLREMLATAKVTVYENQKTLYVEKI